MERTFGEEVVYVLELIRDQLAGHFIELLLYAKENAGHIIWELLGIVLIFVIARGALAVVSHFTSRAMEHGHKRLDEFHSRRVDSIMTLTRSAARYFIYFVALMLVLAQFGGDKVQKVLLAVGSIAGIAFGFGAQNLVQDVVTGMFMMFENQFSVGDYIQTEDAVGTVQAIAVRVTYLRSLKGDQIIIPNGSIGRVINYTRGSYMAVITVSVSYEQDTRQVIQVIDEILAEYAEEHRDLIEEPPMVRGIDSFGASTVDLGIICRVKPMKQMEVERGMRLAIKEGFDSRGLEFPYPRLVTVPWGQHYTPSEDGMVHGPEDVPEPAPKEASSSYTPPVQTDYQPFDAPE